MVGCLLHQAQERLIPTVVPFPGGIKGYLRDPARILDARPPCPACGGARMDVHERCERGTDADGVAERTIVFRLLCPACGRTTRLLPDFMVAGLRSSLGTVADACEGVLEDVTYRGVAVAMGGEPLPAGESVSTVWGGPDAPLPGPSTIFRWVARLAASAAAWWPLLLAEAQARDETALRPPAPPEGAASRARSEAKARALRDGWHLLWLARELAARFGIAPWAKVLVTSPSRPTGLDRTGLFLHGAPGPP